MNRKFLKFPNDRIETINTAKENSNSAVDKEIMEIMLQELHIVLATYLEIEGIDK